MLVFIRMVLQFHRPSYCCRDLESHTAIDSMVWIVQIPINPNLDSLSTLESEHLHYTLTALVCNYFVLPFVRILVAPIRHRQNSCNAIMFLHTLPTALPLL